MDGRAVLVTGASRGIGRPWREPSRPRATGSRCTTASRPARPPDVLAGLPGDGHAAVQADLADPAAVRRMVDEAAEALGGLDVLVNNAGMYAAAPVTEVTYEEWQAAWQHTLAVNLTAAANATWCAVRHMIPAGGGRIINVSSRGAFRGEPGHPAYGASKAGLNAFGQSLARALAPHGIAVTTVAPGFVATDMAAESLAGPAGDEIRGQSPFGRVATAGEIAAAVLYLASAEAEWASGSDPRPERRLVPQDLTPLRSGSAGPAGAGGRLAQRAGRLGQPGAQVIPAAVVVQRPAAVAEQHADLGHAAHRHRAGELQPVDQLGQLRGHRPDPVPAHRDGRATAKRRPGRRGPPGLGQDLPDTAGQRAAERFPGQCLGAQRERAGRVRGGAPGEFLVEVLRAQPGLDQLPRPRRAHDQSISAFIQEKKHDLTSRSPGSTIARGDLAGMSGQVRLTGHAAPHGHLGRARRGRIGAPLLGLDQAGLGQLEPGEEPGDLARSRSVALAPLSRWFIRRVISATASGRMSLAGWARTR